MKKLFTVFALCLLSLNSLYADDVLKENENLFKDSSGDPLQEVDKQLGDKKFLEQKKNAAIWPAVFAIFELPETPDLVGIRFTVPFSTKQESITGIDVGLWGRCQYFEGLQLSLIRNDARERCSGLQVGMYNTIGRGTLGGIQVGLWNEAHSVNGIQAGIVNIAGDASGFQVGLINRCETMNGFQIGAINVIRDAEVVFCPLVNIGF
jgi:hypothetical protein